MNSAIRSPQSAVHNPQSAIRNFTKRLLHYLSAGLYAGLLLALIEAIDRSAVLAQYFSSRGERLLLICTLAFVPAGNLLLGVIVAALCSLGAWILARVRTSRAVSEPILDWASRPLLTVGAGALLVAAALGFYWLDSRLFVGRYQYFFHFPAAIGAIAASFIFGLVTAHRLRQQRLLFAFLALVTITATLIGGYNFNRHQAVKALFWRRGVIAKKYVAFAQYLVDFDRDGFSPLLGGGDCDDYNSARNPLAREIPGNGIDDNCLGGDLKAVPKSLSDLNQKPLPERPIKNILFITVDCLRADHLGCYGYFRKPTPNIDRFATRAVLFENAYSFSTNTGHSFSGIARSNYGEAIFDDNVPTVAELFAANGRVTAAITSPKTDEWLWKQGWESYKKIMLKGLQTLVHDKGGYWDSKKLTDKTIEYLRSQQEKPFYVWVHYNDLHAKNEKYVKQGGRDFGNAPVDIYDSNLSYTDDHMGRLLAYLESSGLLDTTVVAISADHGEEFLDHGQQFHNGRPYRDQTHVPLILWYPGAQPLRVREPVSDIDLGPTFLRSAGLLPPRDYVGLDLMQTIAGLASGRQIFMETPRNVPQGDFFAWAMVEGDWRLIYDLVGNTYELYNEQSDPEERHNLIDQMPERARALTAALGQWLDVQSQHKGYRYWARF